MTLVELFIALSVFGSAIVGAVSGWGQGAGCAVLGILLGPLIGLATVCLLVFLPGYLVAKSPLALEKKSGSGFSNTLENAAGLLLFPGIFLSPPVAWWLTVGAVELVKWFFR